MEGEKSQQKKLRNIFWETTWRDRNLGSVTQAGLVNNLNDGMVWGLFPVLLASKGFALEQIGVIAAIYPAFWGIGQLFTGKMADHFCQKKMLFWGMLLQGLALLAMLWASTYAGFLLLSALLGIGTAVVYPTFLTALARHTHPEQRAKSIGIFRLWRDLGYAIGALLTGVLADTLGLNASLLVIGLLTILSSGIIQYRMSCEPEAPDNACWSPAAS
jgi:MFS family permease